ncbi:germin-like protein 9-3 [Populus alba x Populus x berolinensis]|nr:germin-like protein 9-3 [Populus alba x Populus x berolinensis]
MAMNSLKPISSILFLLALVTAKTALASDPDILSDFIAPTNTSVDGKLFTFTGMRGVLTKFPQNFTLTKATMNEFPALNGQSVSYAVLQYTADGPNPPRTHPRAAELLFLVYGCLEVGFVDTKNVFYTQSLQVGDIANAGTVSVPLSVFSTGIDDGILAKAFKTDLYTIQKIKSGFGKP